MSAGSPFFTIDRFTVCCSVTLSLNGSETGGDLALIQTYLLLSCKCLNLIYIIKAVSSLSNKFTSSLAAIQRPGHWADHWWGGGNWSKDFLDLTGFWHSWPSIDSHFVLQVFLDDFLSNRQVSCSASHLCSRNKSTLHILCASWDLGLLLILNPRQKLGRLHSILNLARVDWGIPCQTNNLVFWEHETKILVTSFSEISFKNFLQIFEISWIKTSTFHYW